jgi:4-hydroxy-tetrahydrodipicolinate synthase
MVADGLAGRMEQGRKHAEALLPLTLALFAEPSPAVIKAALHAQGRIPSPDVRLPLTNASAAALAQATAVLSTFGSNDHFLAS